MRGAVAAGSRQAVEAGAWALREGGTAVDGAVAAVLAAFVAEGPLTGPAGGGFLLVDRPAEPAWLLDCFFAVPAGAGARDGRGRDRLRRRVDAGVPRGRRVGRGSRAGRGSARRARPLRAPAVGDAVRARSALAARPIEATAEQRFLHEILTAILQRDEGGRRIYGTPGAIVGEDLVPTLRLLRDAADEAAPPPAARARGRPRRLPGRRAGAARDVLRRRRGADDADAVAWEEASSHEVSRRSPTIRGSARARGRKRPSRSRGRSRRATAGSTRGARSRPARRTSPSSTPTGRVAALSSTLGSGAGVFRHGFQLNNMLGELDVIGELPHEPGARLPSMMTPSLGVVDGAARIAVGSAGSVRLSGAILQVLVRVLGGGVGVEEAIAAPRLHVDGETVHVEGGWDDRVADLLGEDGWEVVRWADRNLFFGGVERRRAAALPAGSAPRATRGAAVTASWSRDRGPSCRAGRRRAASSRCCTPSRRSRSGGSSTRTVAHGVAEERRYLRAVRRHADAAVYVAERRPARRRPALARPRPSSGQRARRRSRADGRLRLPPAGDRARCCSSRRSRGRARPL